MAGRGEMLDEDMGVIADNVYLLDDQGRVQLATNPLNQYSTIRKGLSEQKIGPGFSFAQNIAARTGRKILLVVNARGGTALSEWLKDAETGYFKYFKIFIIYSFYNLISKYFPTFIFVR